MSTMATNNNNSENLGFNKKDEMIYATLYPNDNNEDSALTIFTDTSKTNEKTHYKRCFVSKDTILLVWTDNNFNPRDDDDLSKGKYLVFNPNSCNILPENQFKFKVKEIEKNTFFANIKLQSSKKQYSLSITPLECDIQTYQSGNDYAPLIIHTLHEDEFVDCQISLKDSTGSVITHGKIFFKYNHNDGIVDYNEAIGFPEKLQINCFDKNCFIFVVNE
ncbi:hypothetical protein DICPUDRAFT_84188 [Dictyostelium purpureum]|uniref:Calcium-dependent cell adhesion molecule 1 membrane-binding domain-containing protein n=1 Tax=Dictyostelium purpureum TaxID=5786 RepID=F1A1U8_DICPU|nr:uncharacterized protein DICPUDRAFT_84188 [Dictyostelium purpureum]EGC29840.1 hypothetical protein DICPUDRAFT_84188 [Dictyostelium purpureum]|eukprot:XP_003293638.1 hypothetical protein DICPUDRAFT_84188 [Dictyostelium purpureum]